jgi:hypothetical protein
LGDRKEEQKLKAGGGRKEVVREKEQERERQRRDSKKERGHQEGYLCEIERRPGEGFWAQSLQQFLGTKQGSRFHFPELLCLHHSGRD